MKKIYIGRGNSKPNTTRLKIEEIITENLEIELQMLGISEENIEKIKNYKEYNGDVVLLLEYAIEWVRFGLHIDEVINHIERTLKDNLFHLYSKHQREITAVARSLESEKLFEVLNEFQPLPWWGRLLGKILFWRKK